MAKNGFIFDIKRYAVHDGPGIRTTVFFKGCPLRCWWCHNPEGISNTKALMFFEYKCMKCRTCAQVCPADAITFENDVQHIDRQRCDACGICYDTCPTEALKIAGSEITVEELMKQIERDVLLYDNSGGGVTFSGGEPIVQHEFLKEVLMECKKRDIRTALDTSGYAPENVFSSVIDYVDVFLFDLKLGDSEEHKKYTGASNDLIKHNLRMLADTGRGNDVFLRFPVIPGITDTEKNIDNLTEFVSSLKNIHEIDLLPFHDISEKYNRLGIEYKMPVRQAPPQERLMHIKQRFEDIGIYVKI